MDLVENIFSYDTSVCVCCNNKKLTKNMAIDKGVVGICNNCIKTFEFTMGEGAFEGKEFVSYVMAPLYYRGGARRMIKNLKFYDEFATSKVIFEIFKNILEDAPHLADFDMVVPIPLSYKKMNNRGYNQAALIANCVATHLCIPMYEDVVKRVKNTGAQSKMSQMRRIENVRDAFLADESVEGKRIILVDDVYTTGNTLNSCAKSFIDKKALEVVGVSVAVSLKNLNSVYM